MKKQKKILKTKALKRARILSKYTNYVAVVESSGKYDVEFEPPLLRPFEKLLVEYSKGKLIKKVQNDTR
ncbi:MAG: hypothetical protein GYA14_15800 [Ignavibacteria bacterium]|nr:hypothetical protein [Ignavibacteria bacterium]